MELLVCLALGIIAFKAIKYIRFFHMARRYREWTPAEEQLAQVAGGVEGIAYSQERKKKYLLNQLHKGKLLQRPWNERDREHFIEAYKLRSELLNIPNEAMPEIATKAGEFYDQHVTR